MSQSCARQPCTGPFPFSTRLSLRQITPTSTAFRFSRMLCLAIAAAAAALAPLAAASELAENVTITPSVGNATSTAWAEAGSKLQIALASADAQLLPLAGDLLPYTQLRCTLPWFDARPLTAYRFPSSAQLPSHSSFFFLGINLHHVLKTFVKRPILGAHRASCAACASASCGASRSLPSTPFCRGPRPRPTISCSYSPPQHQPAL
jgi:hypothetical protein